MSNITTIKGSLFDAPKGSIIIHACNCQGMWGSGIAKEFANRFPGAYRQYRDACFTDKQFLLGSALLLDDMCSDHLIGCLFTSNGYGPNVDSKESILENTKLAIEDLIFLNEYNLPMHMCKINSGLFKVPWEETEKVLKEFDAEFTVYDY